MKLSKDTIEFIDQICENSVNHPVEFDYWPFETFEERLKEDEKVASIAQFIAREVTNDECDPMLDILMAHQKMLESITRILKELDIEGHFKNIDKRVYDLEKKPAEEERYGYK